MKHTLVTCFIALLLLINVSTPAISADSNKADRRKTIKLCRQYLKTAVKHLDNGDYKSAVILLDSVLICDSKNPDGYYYLGKTYLLLGDTTQAVEKLSTGVTKAPMSSRLKLLLARLRLNDNRLDESQALIDQVLAIKPHNAEALFLKGMLLTAQADTASAVEQYRKALEIWRERTK